jgi:putative (di)nucleoside polyphosphate hydrolase
MDTIEPQLENPREPLCDWSQDYRPNVAALIMRQQEPGKYQLLLGERRDLRGFWQWPQGGIDQGETPLEALQREVFEETGIRSVRVLYPFPFRIRYRFPKALGQKFYPRVGQEQQYFVVAINADEKPDLNKASSHEFIQLSWRNMEETPVHTVWFKRAVYEAVISHLGEVMNDPSCSWFEPKF